MAEEVDVLVFVEELVLLLFVVALGIDDMGATGEISTRRGANAVEFC